MPIRNVACHSTMKPSKGRMPLEPPSLPPHRTHERFVRGRGRQRRPYRRRPRPYPPARLGGHLCLQAASDARRRHSGRRDRVSTLTAFHVPQSTESGRLSSRLLTPPPRTRQPSTALIHAHPLPVPLGARKRPASAVSARRSLTSCRASVCVCAGGDPLATLSSSRTARASRKCCEQSSRTSGSNARA